MVLVTGGLYSMLRSAELYDPSTETWTATGSLVNGNDAHQDSTVRLNDGRVLVAGGGNCCGGGTYNSAELYEPGTGTFQLTGSLGQARKFATLTLLADGKALAVGGRTDAALVGTAETYDPGVGTWSAAGSLGEARYVHRATLLSNGDVLVAGGFDFVAALASAEIYIVGPCVIRVAIDIKPGSDPNSINLSSAGVVPVAILSSATFDATQVDPASVTLAGARVKLIGKGDRYSCSPQGRER